MRREAQKKTATAFRLTEDARTMLVSMANEKGVSLAAVVEMLIREEAKRQGIQIPPPKE